jgi:L-ascorbate metabolism protein UlaG (beta-lactamase superfamily)
MKRMILYLVSFLLLFSFGVAMFMNLHPAFGGKPTKEQKEAYNSLNNYLEGKFVNAVPASAGSDSVDSPPEDKSSKENDKERSPAAQISVGEIDWERIKDEKDSLTWLGHSAFLISIDNKKLLLDPMLGPSASPVSFVVKRYNYSEDMLSIIDNMPNIDAVLISHDHYDHLDYQSIVRLKSKVSHFFVPLGVGAHLIRWGVPAERITELNWWDEREYQGLTLALTPSRHFSGRKGFDYRTTLWGGWALLGENTRLYYSGDGGYGPHFKEIGNKYGPFDLTLIEGAQYDRRWPDSHMMPEQSVQAHKDAGGRNMILMHWGAFTLANHDWKEPIGRALKEAEKAKVNLAAPRIGETVQLGSDLQINASAWWDF